MQIILFSRIIRYTRYNKVEKVCFQKNNSIAITYFSAFSKFLSKVIIS